MPSSSPRAFQRLSRLVLVALVCSSVGLHWAAIQTVAWTGMIVSFSRTEALGVAVQKTFSGEHPCDLCKAVQAGRGDEQEQQSAKPLLKLDAVLTPALRVAAREARTSDFARSDERAEARTLAPPTPPPLPG